MKTVQRPSYLFTADWFSARISQWQDALGFLKGRSGLCALEVGSYEGRSAIWMLENLLTGEGCTLICVDRFDEDDGSVERRFDLNISFSGRAACVRKIKGDSFEVLKALPTQHCDLIYVDASHDGERVLEDIVLAFACLKVGGVIVVDDYRWSWRSDSVVAKGRAFGNPIHEVDPHDRVDPGVAIRGFLAANARRAEVISCDWQIFVRRTR
jgi:predicted O-methyltransferase YrrM